MHIQLDINEKHADFFLQYLDSLKEGIIKNVVITDDSRRSFMVSSTEEVRKHLADAEKNADYKEHDNFWKEMDVS
jgi:hypothetical protein